MRGASNKDLSNVAPGLETTGLGGKDKDKDKDKGNFKCSKTPSV